MKNRNILILKILKSNKKLFMVLLEGMILSDLYIEYCVYGVLKDNNSLKYAFKENYIYILITFIFVINYGFVLNEILTEHLHDFNVLEICGKDKEEILKMLFNSITLIWIKCFIISVIIFYLLLFMLSQEMINIFSVIFSSFIINFILNIVIIIINGYKSVIKTLSTS